MWKAVQEEGPESDPGTQHTAFSTRTASSWLKPHRDGGKRLAGGGCGRLCRKKALNQTLVPNK